MQSYTADADADTVISGVELWYDEQSRISAAFYSLDYASTTGHYFETLTYGYYYDPDTGDLTSLTFMSELITDGLKGTIKPTYDGLGRTETKTISYTEGGTSKFYNKIEYTYKTSSGGNQTGLIERVNNTVKQSESGTTVSSSSLQYVYDANGNITAITDNSAYLLQYVYDDLGQVIRENINTPSLSATYVYTYDNAGNITSKTRYAFTTSSTLGSVKESLYYTYSDSTWGDLLTNFYNSSADDTIEYDAIGNPITIGYYAGDEEAFEYGYNLTWNGRQLVKIQNFEYYGDSVSDFTAYTYNADGIRTSKTVNGVKHEYILNGSQILAETWYQSGVAYLLVYLYDETGAPIGLKYRTSNYANGVFDSFFFEKNLQGDIVAIYNSTGEKIGTYAYTAFGEVVTTTVSGNTTLENNIVNNYNPFRYRGYYYDVETGWYYLQSRYYNPNMGRFLNTDACLYNNILGFNMFAYCYNDPVNYIDPYGESGVATALAGWASSAWGLTLVDGPIPVGDIIYVAGCVVLGGIALIETVVAVDMVVDIVAEATDTNPESSDTPNDATDPPQELPNQGDVSEDPDAPPVDAGKQGKHVPGHNNNDPNKTQWKQGETGVKETQEAWKNGTDVPNRNGRIRIGQSKDGRTIRVHMDSKGRIHGYPIFPQ